MRWINKINRRINISFKIEKIRVVSPALLHVLCGTQRRYFEECLNCFCTYNESQWGPKHPHWTPSTFIIWTLKTDIRWERERLLTSETVPEVMLCIIVLKKHVPRFMNAARAHSWVLSLAANTSDSSQRHIALTPLSQETFSVREKHLCWRASGYLCNHPPACFGHKGLFFRVALTC